MHIKTITILTIMFLSAASCAFPGAGITPADPTATGAAGGSGAPGYTRDWLEGLPGDTVVLQMDIAPTFFREEAFYPFGRVPPFTLYADGSIVYIEEGASVAEQRILSASVGADEILTLVRDVMDAGFEGLEDSLDDCFTDENGEKVCIADAAVTILSATLSTGEYRQVSTYADFSNDPGAFEEIVLIMSEYTHPEAELFRPQRAALFIRALPGDFALPVRMWPLSPDRLPHPGMQISAMVLNQREIEAFVQAVGSNTGEFYFDSGGTTFSAYLVPWLPHADYTEQVDEIFPAQTPAPAEEPFMSIQEKAIADLVERLGISEDEITVSSFKEATWSNGCLGIAFPDRACTEALVPGYQLILVAEGDSYEYRSDRDGSLVLFADDTASPPIESPDE